MAKLWSRRISCRPKFFKLCVLVLCIVTVSQYTIGRESTSSSNSWLENLLGKLNQCSSIHLAIACEGFSGPRSLSTLVKSLVFHRSRPIHLHLITDNNSKLTLEHLFETWNIPHLKTAYYSLGDSLSEIQKEGNSISKSIWKLSVPHLLPLWVDQVIVLENNLIFDHDVAELWSQFSSMSENEAIGLVEEQSKRYVGGKGEKEEKKSFNTDVMLLDLSKLRSSDWERSWKKFTEKSTRSKGVLNDSDVLNSLRATKPIFRSLPCEWNVQLSSPLAENCYRKAGKMKVINLHSSRNARPDQNVDDLHRYMESGFQQLDGNVIRSPVLHCSYTSKEAKYLESDTCEPIREAASAQYRTHLFYSDFHYVSSHPNDVTWVAHLTPDRLNMVELLCKHWKGPISLAFYLTDSEAVKLLTFINSSPILKTRKDVGYHIIYKQGEFYPINFLRNVALEQVRTPFVILSDIDFLPMPDLHNVLKKHIGYHRLATHKKALIVPAFETLQREFDFPKTKKKLITSLQRHTLFHFMEHTNKNGQIQTNYNRWKSAEHPYEVQWNWDFEPYVVVHRDVARYDLRFVGYHYNKAAHILELKAQGYRFHVLPDVYIIHLVHAISEEATRYETSLDHKKCLDQLKDEFIKDITAKYPGALPIR